jgi:site-specific recombinase XerD
MALLPTITSHPAADRKIGRHHLAFFRGWLQGLDIKVLSTQYLEVGMDLRRARATLDWIKDVVRMASLRHGKIATARLLRIRFHTASALYPVQPGKRHPTLAQFREEYDAVEILTEKELIQAYTELYPQTLDQKAVQRNRLISRQLEALVWVEGLLATAPQKTDYISAWFDETVANRLVLAKITTLGSLIARIEQRGYRWWTTVPGLGVRGAKRITTWLQGYEDALGALPLYALDQKKNLPSIYLLQQRPVETGIVPFESFVLPANLDGSQGVNRYKGMSQIEANTDIQAIRSWLLKKGDNAHTRRAYKKAAERFLLWTALEKGRALSDLNVDDCADYRNWLSSLDRTKEDHWLYNLPQKNWVARRNIGRYSKEWRPFSGPLSADSLKLQLTILSGLFEWLIEVRYLSFNPWVAVSRSLVVKNDISIPDLELTHVLTLPQWEYLIDFLRTMPDSKQSHQMRFVFEFAYTTGMRRSELVNSTTGRIYSMPLQDGSGTRWMLKVLGKGNKWRAAPLTDNLLNTMWLYFVSRGLSPVFLDNPPDTPLVSRQGSSKAMSESGLHKAIKAIFNAASLKLDLEGRTEDAKKFQLASTHWLRHTRGSHLGASGTPIVLIQRLFGHANIQTTGIYLKSSGELLWESLNN